MVKLGSVTTVPRLPVIVILIMLVCWFSKDVSIVNVVTVTRIEDT